MTVPLEDLRHHPSAGNLRLRPRRPKQEAEILRLTAEGLSGYRIAELTGCSPTHVRRIMRAAGVEPARGTGQEHRRSVPTAEVHSVIWRYAEEREPAASIARSYGCSVATIYKVLDEGRVARQNQTSSDGARNKGASAYRPTTRAGRRRNVVAPHMRRKSEDAAKVRHEAPRPPGVVDLASTADDGRSYRKALYAALASEPSRSARDATVAKVAAVVDSLPRVPAPDKTLLSTRNGQVRAPLRPRFPPLPGEPGYVYGGTP